MKTKDRIRVTAQAMFNANRYGNVSTPVIAAALGITEGNLWYHYNSKRDIVEAVNQRFVAAVSERLTLLPSGTGPILDEYVAMLGALAAEIREYRFLYRDQADYGEHTETLRNRLPEIYCETEAQFERFLCGMIAEGYLNWPVSGIPSLARNIVIILRYHLEFLRERGEADEEGSGAVTGALEQHLTLFGQSMDKDALDHLRKGVRTAGAIKPIAAL